MTNGLYRALLVAGSAVLVSLPAIGQDGKATPNRAVSGVYRLSRVDIGSASVSMDFSATLFNPGTSDLYGEIELRDPRVVDRVWSRFGRQTIPAGGKVEISDVVSIPREIYDAWSRGETPGVFVNLTNDRGNVSLHRVILSRAP